MIRQGILILLVIMISACQSTDSKKDKLTIAVAASAHFAFNEIGEAFTQCENIPVEFITGSSGKATTQIINGAPYDIFVSANMDYPKFIIENDKAASEVLVYAYGVPVLWTMNDTLNIENFNDLIRYEFIERIAIADPKTAPYGVQAMKYLEQVGNIKKVEKRLVYGESISQVNEYVLNNSVQVGITAKSVVTSERLKNKGRYKELGKEYYIEQGMVVVKNKTSMELKNKFIEFVVSDKGKKILKKYGYDFKNNG